MASDTDTGLVERVARAIYERRPFVMGSTPTLTGATIGRAFDWDGAPAYYQADILDLARAAVAAMPRPPGFTHMVDVGWRNPAPDAAASAVTTGHSVIVSTAALSRPSADFAAVVEQCARKADDIGKRYHYSTDRCACQRTSTAELIAAAIRSIQAPDEGVGL